MLPSLTPPLTVDEKSDNNDYCNSCGGTGFLLCCDGCDNAFHLACLDPPLTDESAELNESWFCHICVAKRNPPAKPSRGLFAQLLQNLEKRNPTNFVLPQSVREYFDGVSTGKDAKFTELQNVKTRNRAGYDEPLDLLKIKDGKGKTILCYHCGKSAAGRREIITCDVCNAHWHLDCTDPPLANPPFRDQWNRKVRDWQCPLHIDQDLRAMDSSRISVQRTFFMRKPKQPKIVDTSLRRGQINNGIIEIAEDSSSEEESEVDENDSTEGNVVRLPPKGIKLDFIYKINSNRRLLHQARTAADIVRARNEIPEVRRDNFTKRSFLEKQTALSLVQFAQQDKNGDLALNGNKVDDLIGTLIVEAPADVVEQLTAAEQDSKSGTRLSEEQRKELLMLQELITRKLQASVPVNGA